MRHNAAVRIDLGRGERQDDACRIIARQPLERGEEEPRVAGRRFNVPVAGDDEDHRSGTREDRRRERLRGRRQPGNRLARRRTPP